MSLPEPPSVPHQFITTNRGQKAEFTGSVLISKEELAEAAKHDKYLNDLRDFVDQDIAFLGGVQERVSVLMRDLRNARNTVRRMKDRIASRKRQIDYFTKLLRKRMAYERGKELRKEIGLD